MSLERNKKWHDKKLNVPEAFCYMYKYSIFNDITIQATKNNGSSLCFSAHKLVLAMKSPIFADMFYSSTETRNIISLNVSSRSLDILLWYIYSDDIEGDNIEELLESFDDAVLYKISSFPEVCAKKLLQLSSQINSSNLFAVINVACHSKSNELFTKCIQFIKQEPENIFLDDFLTVSEETFWKMIKELYTNICPKIILKAVMKWMIGNNLTDKKNLSFFDLTLLSADDFLNVVEEFQDFFSREETRCILSNLLISNSCELPLWCKFSKNKECIKVPLPSSYEGLEIIKENSVKVQTECNHRFSKMSFFSNDGFQQDLLLKVSVQYPPLHLVIVELAFGTDYVPLEKLNVELRSNTGPGRKMQVIQHYLLSSRRHFYMLLCDGSMLTAGNSFNLYLRVDVTGLRKLEHGHLVSNLQYTPVSVSNYDSTEISTRCTTDGIPPELRLKPFSEFLILVDSNTHEKNFIISALYFDKITSIQNYMTYMKKQYSTTDFGV